MAGNNRSSLVVQERDLRLFEALETMRVMDREQAKIAGGFHSTTRANARLLALTKAGFLKRAFLGSRQAVYWLASNSQQRSTQKELTPREPAALFLRHRLEINKVYLLLKHTAIPCSRLVVCPLARFPEEPRIGGSPDPGRLLRAQIICRSAGLLRRSRPRHRSTPGYSQKGSALSCTWRPPANFQTLFHQPQFRVLVIANSERRLQNLRAAIAKLTDKIFWLTTLESINRDRFWSAVWLRPTGDQMQSLL